MLEPTNNKTAETNNSTPTKPVEIQHDLFDLKPNEISSYSAYASAESSPAQGNSLIPKQELKQQINKSESSSTSSSSLNSYLTIENSSKLLMMDDLLLPAGRETPTNNSTKTLTTTETFLDDYDQAASSSSNRNYLEDEFQSLPCHYPDDLILQPTKFINNSSQQQAQQETVNSLINKEIEEQLIDFKANQQQQPSTSPSANSKSSIKSAIGCFFEKVLFGSNEKTPPVVVEPLKPSSDNLMNKSKSSINFTETSNKLLTSNESVTHTKLPTSTTTNGIASASSPNPDCSPYKLLLNEIPSTSNIVINDFNSRNLINSSTTNTNTNTKNNLNENEKELNKNSDKPNNLIENLASLNQKESDKIDPILSQLVNAKTTSVSSIDKVEQQLQQKQAKKTTNDSDDVLKQPVSSLVNEISLKVDHVPASSHEFCMDLNFNLAAAAAATAAGPVVVSALPPPLITTTTTNSSIDHNRFTSNASTSSIHNDLKMILEESKDQKQEQKHKGIIDSPTQQKSKINKLQPKPQRVHNTSGGRTKSASSTSENNNKKSTEFISSDSNNLNLIKTLMSMVENNKKNNSKQQQQQDKPVINWPKKENGRYRYTKEFLNQINEQRAEFIDQIYPEIFRVYSTCMNGKYWDPEQYFDIIQFPDDFDKSKNSNNRSMNNSRSYNSSVSFSNNNNNNNQKQQSNRKRNISTTSNGNKYDNTKSKYQSNTISHSPQPLQVPKNSPKVSNHDQQNNLNLSTTSSKNGKENKRKFNSILSTLGLEQTIKSNNADKILLDLIKNKASSNDKNNNNNLLDMLNTKKEQFENKTRSSNILDTLLMNSQKQQQQHQSEVSSLTNSSSSSKHFPVVLTAQELEMSQMLTQQKNSRHKLPINQNEISNFIEFESTNNTSDAYKQLVKNLSNHPLNAPTTATGVPTTINNNQQKTNNNNKQNQQPNWPVSNNGTNVLKQLLNLKIEQPIQKTTEKKSKSKKGHHHHHHNNNNNSKTKSPSTSMLASESINKFPVVNPHEKPFENYLNEDSSSKQVEIVVASTLSHVLNNNKSPTNVLENLFEKMNTKKKSVKSENDHFYSLLNKMMPVVDTNNRQKSKQQQQQINESSSSSSDILKWFTGNTQQQTTTNTTNFTTTSTTTTKFSPTVLSEIEFMEMQRPQVLNKLY